MLDKSAKCAAVFLIIILVSFVALDFAGFYRISGAIKFIGVLCCFALTLLRRNVGNKKSADLLCLALLFTVISDVFLLFTDLYAVGVLIFCIAHSLYVYRNTSKQSVFIFYIATLCLVVSLYYIINPDIPLLWVASMYYAFCILSSTITSFLLNPQAGGRKIVIAGMLLFIMCDICVAISKLSFSWQIKSVASKLVWAFYLSSQYLLSISKV